MVHVSDLQNERVILLTKFREGRQAIEVALQALPNRAPIETQLAPIACVLALEGQGVAIVDPFSASEFGTSEFGAGATGNRGLAIRILRPILTVGTAVVVSRDRQLSIVAQEFHAAFLAHARAFLAGEAEQPA